MAAVIWQIVAIVSLWWAANAVTTIAAKFMMETQGGIRELAVNGSICGWGSALEDLRWLDLSTLQHLFGAVASVILVKTLNGKSTPIWPSDSPKVTVFVIVLANIVSSLATNSAYAASFASLSATFIKACEPLFTFLLSMCLYNRDDFNTPTLFSLVVMIVGVTSAFTMVDTSFNTCGFLAALLASFGFAVRSIHLKKLSWESPFQKYAVVSIGSTLFLVPVTLLKLAVVSTHTSSRILGSSVISSMFHFIYNTASIAVLEEVSPLTLAVLNLSRRVCEVIANLVYFYITPFSLNLMIGLVIFIIGIALYYHYKTTGNASKLLGRKAFIFLFATCIVILAVGISSLKASPTKLIDKRPHVTTVVEGAPPLQNNPSHFTPTVSRPIASHPTEAHVTLSTLLSNKQQISTAWVFERDIPQVAVNNVQNLQTVNSERDIRVYCGTSNCMQTMTGLNITAEFLVVSELVKDTPLEKWLARHPLNKVLAGLEFENHLQIVTQLAILWQYGGTYVNPMVTFTDNTRLPSCRNGWISNGKINSFLEVSCFPKFHPFIQTVMKNFVRDYPKNGTTDESSRFRFSFQNVLNSAYSSCIADKNCHVENNTLKYTASEVGKTLDHHFGTLSFDSRVRGVAVANLGDEVQDFPGVQFLPFVDQFLERDKLNLLKTKEPVTAFFNAWWGDPGMSWPPPTNVHPIMTSVHIEGAIQGKWKNRIEYLRDRAPIGCRDLGSLNFLQKNNIDSYFSGCLTLMFKNPTFANDRTDNIYLVDVKKEIKDLLPMEIQKKGIPVKHYVQTRDSLKRFSDSFKLIESYASARVVVTQRIHCALPCVAMGIPVVFINSAGMPGGGGSKNQSSARIVGLTPLFNTLDMYKMSSKEEAQKWLHDFDWNNPPPNPNMNMMMRMRATFWDVIRQNQALYDSANKFGMIPLHPPPALDSEHHELLFHLVFTTSAKSNVGLFGAGGSMKGGFNWRHWRTLESIFHHHPFARVMIHSNTLQQSEFNVLTEAGYRVEVTPYNLEEMLRDSPAHEFIKKIPSASKGGYWYSHLSDLLRMLLISKWGGIYMDTDMIVVRPLNKLKNVLGYETEHQLNGAFMTFEKNNPYIRDCLVEFAQKYRGSDWAGNGPSLLTRVYNRKWKNNTSVVSTLREHAFYLFHWKYVQSKCFGKVDQSLYDAKMKILKEEAYVVHLNSKITGKSGMNGKLENGTLCKHILNAYCVLCDRQY